MEGELVILLDKDIQGPILGVPGVPGHLRPARHRPVQRQVQVRRHGQAGRGGPRTGPLLPRPALFNVPVAVAISHMFHNAARHHTAHIICSTAAAVCVRVLSVGRRPSERGGSASRRVGPPTRTAGRRLGLNGRDEKGAGRVGVAVAEAVEGLAAVPVGVTAGGHHPTGGVPHPTWRGPLWRTHSAAAL